jgi:hypothetical protein
MAPEPIEAPVEVVDTPAAAVEEVAEEPVIAEA